MSKYEKKGTITFSPTAITDKEEVHELHKKVENPGGGQEWDLVISGSGTDLFAYGSADDFVIESGSVEQCIQKIISGEHLRIVVYYTNIYNGVPVSQYEFIPDNITQNDDVGSLYIEFSYVSIGGYIYKWELKMYTDRTKSNKLTKTVYVGLNAVS